MAPPLIITLLLDEASFLFFDALRKTHFPPERNFIDAHLTLFHHLPSENDSVLTDVEAVCRRQGTFRANVTAIVCTGNGVAYKVESPVLQALHKNLQNLWAQWLIPQDRQKLWPHITIQNKVSPEQARSLQKELSDSFAPFEIEGLGLSIWHYMGGPWKSAGNFYFNNSVPQLS